MTSSVFWGVVFQKSLWSPIDIPSQARFSFCKKSANFCGCSDAAALLPQQEQFAPVMSRRRRRMVIRQLYLVTMQTASVMGRHYAAKYASASLPQRSEAQINSGPYLKTCTFNISDCEARRPPERATPADTCAEGASCLLSVDFDSIHLLSFLCDFFPARCNHGHWGRQKDSISSPL